MLTDEMSDDGRAMLSGFLWDFNLIAMRWLVNFFVPCFLHFLNIIPDFEVHTKLA
jgi:hypothetical protein